MRKHRTPYPAEFRAQMVELVKAERTPEELSREFEPTAQTIIYWVVQADRDAGVRQDGLTTAERQELTRLRRENRQLKTEREILSRGRLTRPRDRGRTAERYGFVKANIRAVNERRPPHFKAPEEAEESLKLPGF